MAPCCAINRSPARVTRMPLPVSDQVVASCTIQMISADYPHGPKSGAAVEDHRLTVPPMHFPQICSSGRRIRLEMASAEAEALACIVDPCCLPGSASSIATAYLPQPTQQHIKGKPRSETIELLRKIRYFCIAIGEPRCLGFKCRASLPPRGSASACLGHEYSATSAPAPAAPRPPSARVRPPRGRRHRRGGHERRRRI